MAKLQVKVFTSEREAPGTEAIVDRASIEQEIEGIQARLKALHDELDAAQGRLAETMARDRSRESLDDDENERGTEDRT